MRAGEIVGIAGVAGNGQSQLLRAISGMEAPLLGEIRINGELVRFDGDDSAAKVREMGLAHVPEDRIKMGLVTQFEEWENSLLGYHDSENTGAARFSPSRILLLRRRSGLICLISDRKIRG